MLTTTTIQSLPVELNVTIFHELEFKELIIVRKVCKAWKVTIETNCFSFLSQIEKKSSVNLVIDIPRNLFIDEDLSVKGALLIRAKNIYGKPRVCLSGEKVTFVAGQIIYLGSIEAQRSDSYSNASFLKGPVPGGSSSSLKHYSAQPDFWSSLESSHRN